MKAAEIHPHYLFILQGFAKLMLYLYFYTYKEYTEMYNANGIEQKKKNLVARNWSLEESGNTN